MRVRATAAITILMVGVLLCPAASNGQDTEAQSAIKAVVAQMFTAFQRKDFDGVMACWSAESPQLASTEEAVKKDFALYDEAQFLNVTFTRWNIEGDRAFVQLTYDRKLRDVKTLEPAQLRLFVYVKFVKEAGGWKFSEERNVVSVFAKLLIEAKTKEERAKLLENNKELVTTELVNAFSVAVERRTDKGLFDEALKLSDISLEVADVLGEDLDKGQCYLARGFAYYKQSMHKEALESYERALRLFRDARDEPWEARALNDLGHLYEDMNRHEEALTQYGSSLTLMRKHDDKEGVLNNLGSIGHVCKLLGKYPDSLAANEEARRMVHDAGDIHLEIGFLLEVGMVEHLTGRYADALRDFKLTLELIGTDGRYKQEEAAAINDIGSVYQATGRYAEALEQLEKSSKMAHDADDKAGEGVSLQNVGIIYALTGKYKEALEKYAASLELERAAKDSPHEALTLNSVGNAYKYMGRYDEAIEQYEKSLEIKRAINDRPGEAKTLSNVGLVYQLTGKYVKAMEKFQAALTILRDTGDEASVARISNNIAGMYILVNKYDEALASLNVNLKTISDSGDRLGEATTLVGMGEVYRLRGDWRAAADAYRKAIAGIELIRAETREPSLQTSFFAQYTTPYYRLVEVLLDHESNSDEALAISERAKARTLVEIMEGGKVSILKAMNDAERKSEQDLNANIIAATAQLDYESSGATQERQRVDALRRQVDKAYDDYEEFRRRLFIAHPELQAQRASFAPMTLTQLGETLFAKNPGLCLLSYLVDKDDVLLFVITGGKEAHSPATLKVYSLKNVHAPNADEEERLSADELKRRLVDFRLHCANDRSVYKQMARDLYETLLAPAERELKGKSHVVIIPDGALSALPFQALVDRQGKFFIESHTLSYAPSITALAQMMKLADKKKAGAASRELFAMGRRTFPDQARYHDSELREAEEQVKSIAGMFDVSPLTGADATKRRAVSEMSKARYVHFATHGELNEVAPMYSAIVLGKSAGDDGMLYARELVDMDLQAELVVLSACDTGLGQAVNGEGILGLTWALFVAGTPSSVVTQWEVRDDSMNKLMVEFYRQMRLPTPNGQPPISKAEALKRAQLSLLKTDAYKHPYYWAPVTLVGDWR